MQFRDFTLDPFQEEANINVARLQYHLGKINPANLDKDQIIDRLKFVLALAPQCDKAKKLLKEIGAAA